MRLLEKFNVATVSDIHLGNPRNNTQRTIEGLDSVIITSGLLKRIKLLVIAGDIYDRLLDLSDPSVVDIDAWFLRLANACGLHGVELVVLEGTPSHDRSQPARFKFLHEVAAQRCSFRYINEVSVQTFGGLGITALFVPDEAYPTTQETKEVVKAILKDRNLEKVDLAFMHGFFQYQIPYQTKETAYHDIEFYHSIVRYWIFIGHVHTHSRNNRVIAQGAFDRNSHGEEEPKGMAMASVADRRGDQMWFLENPLAHVYRTIQIYDMDMETVHQMLEEELQSHKDFDRIRIEAEDTHPVFQHMPEVQKRWPMLHFTKHPKVAGGDSAKEKLTQEAAIARWEQISITKDNIVALITEKLRKQDVNEALIASCLPHLEAAL